MLAPCGPLVPRHTLAHLSTLALFPSHLCYGHPGSCMPNFTSP
uniref:Uncharacterized protein n=1 Tax=Setaria italica TaxID=4555 RepID=K3ZPM5_SETIT